MAKLYLSAESDKGGRITGKAGNKELHARFYLGNTLAYHLKMNEYGQLTAYILHDTQEPEIYTVSVLWNEYQAMNKKRNSDNEQRNA